MQAGPSTQLRPLGIGEILDAAFKLYARNFKTLSLCAAVVAVPMSVLTTLVLASTNENAFQPISFDFTAPTGAGEIEDPAAFFAGQGVIVLITALGTLLATGACFRAVSAAYLGSDSTWRQSLGFAARRLHSLVWVSVLVVLATIVGLLMCFVGAFWIYFMLGVVTPVLLVEDVRGRGALKRSWRLVKDKFWHTTGALVVGIMITGALTSIFSLVIVALTFVGPENELLNATLQTLLNAVANTLALPFGAVVLAIVYFDLRVRKEGFDLELLAQRIGAPPPVWPQAQEPGQGQGAPRPRPPVWAPPPPSGFLPPRPPEPPQP